MISSGASMLFDSFHLIPAMKDHLEAQKRNSCIAHTAPPVHLGICLTSAAQQQIERGCNTSSPESPNRCTSPFDFGKRLGCLCTSLQRLSRSLTMHGAGW